MFRTILRDTLIAMLVGVVLVFAVAQACAQTGEPDGFTVRLNAVRAAKGLSPVVGDRALVATAEANNVRQEMWGQGHHYTGGYAQCASVGPLTALEALVGCPGKIGYLDSPSHAALLLHPDATKFAWAQLGRCNTIVLAMRWQARPIITETLIIPDAPLPLAGITRDGKKGGLIIPPAPSKVTPTPQVTPPVPAVEPHCNSIARCGAGPGTCFKPRRHRWHFRLKIRWK